MPLCSFNPVTPTLYGKKPLFGHWDNEFPLTELFFAFWSWKWKTSNTRKSFFFGDLVHELTIFSFFSFVCSKDRIDIQLVAVLIQLIPIFCANIQKKCPCFPFLHENLFSSSATIFSFKEDLKSNLKLRLCIEKYTRSRIVELNDFLKNPILNKKSRPQVTPYVRIARENDVI